MLTFRHYTQAHLAGVNTSRGTPWNRNFCTCAAGICSIVVILAGCGAQQQVSPSLGAPSSRSVGVAPNSLTQDGIAPGYMMITFDVAAALKFSKYQYQVIFNTTGSGKTPEANSWAGYSFALETNRHPGAPSAEAIAFIRSKDPHVPPAQLRIPTTPKQFKFTANSNGAKTEFTIRFQRSIFKTSKGRMSSIWLFNAFTNSKSGTVDSMGSCSSCFVSPKLSVDKAFDQTIIALKKPKGIAPSAKIVSVEFANNP
ncbi:MAG: hypothetical protein WAK19_13905 [Candidatus Cybelea sp.]